jgi:hypothetical protein
MCDKHSADELTYPIGEMESVTGRYGLFFESIDNELTCIGRCTECGRKFELQFKVSNIEDI